MSQVIEQLAAAADLADVFRKVEAGERLSYDDGVRMFRSRELMAVGAMANLVRDRKNGDDAYFVRNMHLNPTNVCTVSSSGSPFWATITSSSSGCHRFGSFIVVPGRSTTSGGLTDR